MAGKRATGANAQTLLKFKSDYDVPATGNFVRMPFTQNELGGEQALLDDPVLGFGRDPTEPMLDVLNVTGNITIPIDTRYMGFWLKGLYGAPTSSASAADGQIVFTTNPTAGQTVTLNGVVFTFIAGASSGNNINIKASLLLTLDELATVLNASADTDINVATYSHPVGKSYLQIVYDATGAAGNAFTLAASHAKPSDKTLIGGGYKHVFISGKDDLPFADIEKGNTDIDRYRMYDSCKFNTLGLSFSRSGAATGVVGVIARGQNAVTETSGGGTPSELTFDRISQFKGYVKSGDTYIGNLTAATFQHSNNMEAVQTIRDDDRIEGADEGISAQTGNFTVRLSNEGIIASADAKEKVDLELGYKLSAGQIIKWTTPQNTLSIPREPINGPGGIECTVNYQGSRDPTLGRMSTITLINDLDGTVYA